MSKNDFYGNDVLVEEFEFTYVGEPAEREASGQPSVKTRLLSMASAMAVAGMLVLGPCSVSTPSDATGSQSNGTVVRIYVKGGQPTVENVPVPESHRTAAARFGRLFRPVPLSDAEKLRDPDFDL